MEKVMKAAILYAPGDLRIENISIPKLKKGEVLIKLVFVDYVVLIFQEF